MPVKEEEVRCVLAEFEIGVGELLNKLEKLELD
jgi:hypothetical protein